MLPLSVNIYTDPACTNPITDLYAYNPDGTVGAHQSQVLGDGLRFFRFWGPDVTGDPPSYFAPKPSGGSIRIDPNPRHVFPTGTAFAAEVQSRISAVQGISSGANPDPLGYAGQISAGRRPAFYRNTSAILSENMSRYPQSVVGNQAAVLTSGVEAIWAYPVVAGDVIGRVIFCSGTTAAASPTNKWATLRDTTGSLLRISSDDTNASWGTNTEKSFVFNTPGTTDGASYTVATSGFLYFGLMVAASTLPSLQGNAWSGVLAKLTPILGCMDNATGKTTPATATTSMTGGTALGTGASVTALPWMQVR